MPEWFMAGFWGFFAGSALLLGAAIGYFTNVSSRVIATVMAFGSGVLISTLAFELMQKAYHKGGFAATACGFLAGALVYTAADFLLSRYGAKFRKRSGFNEKSRLSPKGQDAGSGTAIAVGALLDGIPESIVIGVSMIEGKGVGLVAVVAFFLSNIPEGLSSSAGMKQAGYSKLYIFGIWIGIAVLSGLAALVGYTVFARFAPEVIAATVTVAAGAILAMIVDTMIPEAFSDTHEFAGLVTVIGFLAAFLLSILN